ncbi:MAG: hypothetical protein IJ661_06190 [Lachnospiraceae bacterium]|nr:hypothetical protein [Lachnospiraceae bacterium]
MMNRRKNLMRERIKAISGKRKKGTVIVCLCLIAVCVVCGVLILHVNKNRMQADAEFIWNGMGVEREDIQKIMLYQTDDEMSYPPVDVTDDVLNGVGIPLYKPSRYFIRAITADGAFDISSYGTDERAYSEGLLPRNTINLRDDDKELP